VVGPNLADRYWIHGGDVRTVYATIKQGVPAKGMISWQLVFTPRQIQEIASYVLSLQGSNPPNAKKPEGQLYVGQDTTVTRL
jgi:cytochrome c oxidase cbb3-type subunit 3